MTDFKKYILFTLLILSTSSFAQKKLSKQDIELNKQNCKKVEKYSADARLKLYPYNIASQVMLISFDDTSSSKMQGDDFQKFLNTNLNKVLNASLLSQITEKKILNKTQLIELTNIIYNYTFISKPSVIATPNCYMPSNAILFLDKNNKLIGFLELCFQCNRFRASNNKINIADHCSQKLEMLKAFFLRNGIKYGTTEENDEEE
jgi:hypothetical protein